MKERIPETHGDNNALLLKLQYITWKLKNFKIKQPNWFRKLTLAQATFLAAIIGGLFFLTVTLINANTGKNSDTERNQERNPPPEIIQVIQQPISSEKEQENIAIKEDVINNYIKSNKPFKILQLKIEEKRALSKDQWERLTDYYLNHFFSNYYLETRNSSAPEFLDLLEAISNSYTYQKKWKAAYIFNLFLLYQEITDANRLERVINDFNYTLDMARSSGDFKHDSSARMEKAVVAVVNDTGVRFRQGPGLEYSIIRQFNLSEIVHVLAKSNFTQSIEGANTYWYNICSREGTVGWVYGKYIKLFNLNIYWPEAEEIPDCNAVLHGIKFPLAPR